MYSCKEYGDPRYKLGAAPGKHCKCGPGSKSDIMAEWVPVDGVMLPTVPGLGDESMGVERDTTPSRKRTAETDAEGSSTASRHRSLTPTRVEGTAAAQDGLTPNGKALGEDVEGRASADSSNPRRTPAPEHRGIVPEEWSEGKSGWGTILMPPRPKTDLADGRCDDGACCSHGLLWRSCSRAATWDVAVLGTMIASPGMTSAPCSRMGFGFL